MLGTIKPFDDGKGNGFTHPDKALEDLMNWEPERPEVEIPPVYEPEVIEKPVFKRKRLGFWKRTLLYFALYAEMLAAKTPAPVQRPPVQRYEKILEPEPPTKVLSGGNDDPYKHLWQGMPADKEDEGITLDNMFNKIQWQAQ